MFTSRRRASAAPAYAVELVPAACGGLRGEFASVEEALVSGADPSVACSVVGHALALRGSSLGECLTALQATYRSVRGTDPSFRDVQALAEAWSEATLGYLHQLSCADPMTGLASLAHLRGRLTELYRAEAAPGDIRDTYSLVIVDVLGGDLTHGASARLASARRVTRVGQSARTVFSGAETIARLGTNRLAVLALRDEQLSQRTALLRRLVNALDLEGRPVRVWIEGLPGSDASAAVLMDELARI
ncbi:MAG: hypothetical protein V9G04_10755 [Nocardioides sp.]